jgi:hypothetical protein
MTWRGSGTPLPPLPEPAYEGRHRAPRPLTVDEERIPTDYLAGVVRHMRDGIGIDDAMTLAGIDADDALTAWRQT